MNRVFKIIWNTALNRFDVVSEFAKAGKKCKASTSLVVNSVTKTFVILGFGSFAASVAVSAPLPSIVVNGTISDNNTQRYSATGPAVVVANGGDYTATAVTITSQAPSPGGNMSALYVNSGASAHLDANSFVIMDSPSPATICCTYGVIVDGAGSVVNSSATIIGSTGGASVYGGGRLNLNGGSVSGLFGIVSSGSGSIVTSSADISGSGDGTGVRAELGGSVSLTGGNILSKGMIATDIGSSISATSLVVNGMVRASNSGSIALNGGSVTTGGFGSVGLLADGNAGSYASTSADITMTGGGGGSSAVAARNGATINIKGGNLKGDSYGVSAVSGSQISVDNATITANTSGVIAMDSGTRINLYSGTISMSGWNHMGVMVVGTGAVVENLGVKVIGAGSSSIGAQITNGGSFILRAGGSMIGSGTGIKASGAGSSAVSSGVISATQRAVYAADNGKVKIEGGSLATDTAGSTGIVADSGGQVDVANASLLDTAILAGNGIQVASGGMVNLAGGTLNITAANSSGLIIDGAGSVINSSAPLNVNVSGASGNAIVIANGASQTFQGLTASATGSNTSAIQSKSGANQLTVTDSTLTSHQGPAVVGQSGSLTLNVTNSRLSGPVLVQDNGSTIDITANDNSEIEGSALAANSSITLNSGSMWNMDTGSSFLSSLSLNNGTMTNIGNGSLVVSGNTTLGALGGMFNTDGFDTLLASNNLTGAGNLIKFGDGKLTVAGGIDFTGNTTIAKGTLQIGNGITSGSVHLNQVDNSGILAFGSSNLITVDMVDGTGALEQNGSGTTILLGDNTYSGGTSITAGILQLGDGGSTGSIGGNINIGSQGELAIVRNGAIALGNSLSGSGLISTDTAGQAFNLNPSAGNVFSGTLAIGNGTFMLSGNNTTALSNAILRAGSGSTITVGSGVQTLGGLAFDGGIIKFNTGTPGETVANSTIHTTKGMNLLGAGTVEVNIGSVDNSQTLVNTALSILEQDDTNTQLQLAVSDAPVQGNGGNLALKDQHGNLITDATTAGIVQNGNAVALGTYDYRLTSGEHNDGLYVGYGLTQVELLGSGSQALSLYTTNKTGSAADLSAKVTGSGDLAIDTGLANSVSLSNLDNDYTGNTEVRSGTLLMLNDNVLGNTSRLSLASDTTLDMNGHSQTVGELNAVAGSLLNLNGGDLTLSHGGVSEGELAGNGSLTIDAATLTINGANSGLAATINIASGSQALLNNAVGLGNGNIINAGLLTLDGATGEMTNALSNAGRVELQNNSDITLSGDNSQFSGLFSINSGSQLTVSQSEQLGSATVTNDGFLVLDTLDDWALTNSVTGNGHLTKNGTGVVSFTAATAYIGQTDINAGGLVLGSREAPMTLTSQQVNIADGAFMRGFGGVAGTVDNQGALYVGIPAVSVASLSAPLLPHGDVFTVGGDLNNGGTVYIGNQTSEAGNRLVVEGDYTGNNGLLHFNTALGDDNSVTDSMVVNGNTSGTTRVSVDNAGGFGAKTLNGIELIQINGLSDGEFVQNGRIVAGAYDYSLKRGEGQNAANWYLTSVLSVDPAKPAEPGTPVNSGEETRRPEAGSYTANLAAANSMFVTGLHDRLGETQYIDVLTGEKKVTSLWMRNEGGHNRSRDASGQLSTQSNRYVLQIGGDVVQWSNNGLDRVHLGVMTGYGNNQSSTHSNYSSYKSDATVEGYSVGIYGTWFANQQDKSGLYVDSWAQYSWFDNSVKGESLTNEEYQSKGMTASVESGYTFSLGANAAKTKRYFIQPKAQLTWMGIKADDHREANGTRVSGQGDGNLQTRLGVRTYMEGQNNKGQTFQPFVEASWIHNTKDFATTMNGVEVKQGGAQNIGELKLGIEGQLSNSVNIWGNVGQQMGNQGYSDTGVMLGVKYNF